MIRRYSHVMGNPPGMNAMLGSTVSAQKDVRVYVDLDVPDGQEVAVDSNMAMCSWTFVEADPAGALPDPEVVT